jgi:uncharacterized protein (DUF885 family)
MKKPSSLLVATALVTVGCTLSLVPLNSSFGSLVDDYFDAKFTFEPSSGTAAGFHEFDTRVEDLSRRAIEARIAELKRFQDRLLALDIPSLSFDDGIDAGVLAESVRGDLLDMETLRNWEKNPMVYAALPGSAADSLIKRSFAPAPDRLRSLIERLKAIPALFGAARENVKNPPVEFTELAIRMAKGSEAFFRVSVSAWAKEAAAGDAKLLSAFEATNAPVVAESREFAAWLEKDLLPRSKGAYAIGAESFLKKLRYEDGVGLPLAALLAKGEGRLQKDYDAFVETARRIDPGKTPSEVMTSLSANHPTAGDLLPSVRRSLEDARRFLVERGLVTIPSEVRPRVEETPPYARAGSFASMDTPGPFELKATEAFYYVTPVEPEWDATHQEEHLRGFNATVMPIVNVHEVWPGHYLQFLYAQRFPTKTRKLVFCGTNVEGWAHYTEQMMVDEGFGGGDPRVRLAQLSEALLRDCRYVVGIKLHTQGMTVEEGTRVFMEKGFQERANAFLYYTLGKLMILDLREDYRAKKGGTLRDFHDAFVAQGGLPIPLVRRILFR